MNIYGVTIQYIDFTQARRGFIGVKWPKILPKKIRSFYKTMVLEVW